MNSQLDYESDWLIGEVKFGSRAVSPIRSSILQLANKLSKERKKKGFLLLIDSHISEKRINEEWTLIQRTINPDISARIHIYVKNGESVKGWPEDPDDEISAHLKKAANEELAAKGTKLPKIEYFSVILQILLLNWTGYPSLESKKLTMRRLGKLAGCSYPTVASAIDRLRIYIHQTYSDGIQLKRFPFEEWHSMILGADRIRATMRFVDRSGQPRRQSYLMEQLARMQLGQVGIGGVSGAVRYFPDLDITGDPRLDLSIHAPGKVANIDFINQLDPALEQAEDPMEPAQVVLHFVRSDCSFFGNDSRGIRAASWVECMLDLHEMRLGTQAEEWLNKWIIERRLGDG